MLVMAKCIARAWDSERAREYLPGFEYEIDTESPLASLTIHPVAYDDKGNAVQFYRDNDGKIQSRPVRKPPYVFEFDRAAPLAEKPRDYTCKVCGEKCKSLNEQGTHMRSKHSVAHEEPKDESIVVEKRGKKTGKTFTCKVCGEVLPNLYAITKHNKTHVEAAETTPVPA